MFGFLYILSCAYGFPGVSSTGVAYTVFTTFLDTGSPELSPGVHLTLGKSVPTLATTGAHLFTPFTKPWPSSKSIQSLTHQSFGLLFLG